MRRRSIIGVSADDLGRLKQFSADPKFCAGKFPIASDADTKIAQSYDLNVTPPRAGAKDVNQVDINHAFIERVTFVVGKDGKILATLSSKDRRPVAGPACRQVAGHGDGVQIARPARTADHKGPACPAGPLFLGVRKTTHRRSQFVTRV